MDLQRKLLLGRDLSRDDAAAIVAQGRDAVPAIVEALSGADPESDVAWACCALLGAIGDERAAPALVDVLAESCCDDDFGPWEVPDEAGRALARIGREAVAPLCEQLDGLPDDYAAGVVMETLTTIAREHPDLVETVAAALIRVLEAGYEAPERRGEAASCLMDLDWRPALPAIERAMADRDLLVSDAELEDWRQAARAGLPPPSSDPLEGFAPRHHAALVEYEQRLHEATAFDTGGRVRAFASDLASLEPVVAPREGPRPGRNDPCHCGSGRKYKKCHLDADDAASRPDVLVTRIARLDAWPGVGYAMPPSEQLRSLPREEVEAHVDILGMSPAQLRHRLADETSDYLLWAGAVRWQVLGDLERSADFAVRVAASDAGHPALDYRHIEVLSALPARRAPSPRAILEDWLQLSLRTGELWRAWDVANEVMGDDFEAGLAMYRRVLDAYPGVLWTAASLALAAQGLADPRVVDELRAAVETARAGGSKAHPALPDEPCPVDVLEGWLRDQEDQVEHERHWQRLLDDLKADPLDDEARRFILTWRDEQAALSRKQRVALEDGVPREEALAEHERGRRDLERRGNEVTSGILSGRHVRRDRCRAVALACVERLDGDRGRVLCVTGGDEERVRTVLARLSFELAPEGALSSGPWGGWTAFQLDLDASHEGLLDLLHVLLDEDQQDAAEPDRLALVPFERTLLHALATEEERAALSERARPAEPQESPPPEEPPSLKEYLRHILRRLVRMRKIGAAHTEMGYFLHGVPTRMRGAMKEVLDVLVAEGYVRVKPTVKSPHISLEPAPLRDLLGFMEGGELPQGRLRAWLER